MILSTLNDTQNLFNSRLLTKVVAIFTPEIYWLTESCDIAPSNLNDRSVYGKIRNAMKTTIAFNIILSFCFLFCIFFYLI